MPEMAVEVLVHPSRRAGFYVSTIGHIHLAMLEHADPEPSDSTVWSGGSMSGNTQYPQRSPALSSTTGKRHRAFCSGPPDQTVNIH